MKTIILTILTVAFFSTVTLFGFAQNADALCMTNQDWPDAPCYGCPSCYPGLEQEKLDWEPYYDYKGASWMHAKKLQLNSVIYDNSLREWFKQDDAHKNVHKYYFLHGNVPNIYGMTFEEMLGFEQAWDAVKSNSPDAPLLLWNYHDVILDGAIVESDLAIMITGDDVPLHHIKVNKYFKGERSSELISTIDNFSDLKFELFENGLFYLKKLENQNLYTVTYASIPTFGTCDARDLIEISPVLPNEDPPRSMPVGDIGIDPCIPNYFDVDPDGPISEMQTSEPKPIPEPEQDIPIPTDCGEGTTYQDGICVVTEIKENASDSGTYWGIVIEYPESFPPLKQIKAGISVDDIHCKDGFVKILKKSNDNPACVTPETKSKLAQRNWIHLQFSFCGADGFDSKGNLNKSNSTHIWDENECKWNKIQNAERDAKLADGYSLYPSVGWLHPDDFEDQKPIYKTHPDNPFELILDLDAMLQYQKVLDSCNSTGIQPSIGYVYSNDTHVITNSSCEWETIEEPENENYPFGLTGPMMSQETCDDFVISQWQPTVEGREMSQKFLEICVQRGFTTQELIEKGKVADNFTTGSIQSAKTLAEGDLEKTIKILEEMYRENEKKSVEYIIANLKTHYALEEPVIFEFTESGYGDPCMPITITYYQDRVWMENIVLIDKIIRNCPVGNHEILSSTFNTSEDTEFAKSGDIPTFPRTGEYFIEIRNENQSDGEVVASFIVK